jgi:hypothetical protein
MEKPTSHNLWTLQVRIYETQSGPMFVFSSARLLERKSKGRLLFTVTFIVAFILVWIDHALFGKKWYPETF